MCTPQFSHEAWLKPSQTFAFLGIYEASPRASCSSIDLYWPHVAPLGMALSSTMATS
jgi:hypothetical protein